MFPPRANLRARTDLDLPAVQGLLVRPLLALGFHRLMGRPFHLPIGERAPLAVFFLASEIEHIAFWRRK